MEIENGSTSTRLNRAKSQYESILMGLHLPTENDVTESFIQTRNMRDTYPLYLTDTDDNGLVEDMNAEDIIAEIESLKNELAELRLQYETEVSSVQRRQEEVVRYTEDEISQLRSETNKLKLENQQLKAALNKSKSDIKLYQQQLSEALQKVFRLSHRSFKPR